MTLHWHSYVQCNIVIFDVAYSLMNTEVALCYLYVNKKKSIIKIIIIIVITIIIIIITICIVKVGHFSNMFRAFLQQ